MAVTVIVPLKVPPAAGVLIATVGAEGGGSFVVWDTKPAQPKLTTAHRTATSHPPNLAIGAACA